jgi:hypothetical protein
MAESQDRVNHIVTVSADTNPLIAIDFRPFVQPFSPGTALLLHYIREKEQLSQHYPAKHLPFLLSPFYQQLIQYSDMKNYSNPGSCFKRVSPVMTGISPVNHPLGNARSLMTLTCIYEHLQGYKMFLYRESETCEILGSNF